LGSVDGPAKFSVPVAMHVIDRDRLHARLNSGLAAGTTLIAAPAGWGKSVLTSSWIAAGAGGRAAVWVSLGAADDDEGAFWHTVVAALLPVADDAARAELRRLAAAPAGGSDVLAEFAAVVRQCGVRSWWCSTICMRCNHLPCTPDCCG
jgi:LuxR family transcriptional regulator, maltose regulon positive regulatory protein